MYLFYVFWLFVLLQTALEDGPCWKDLKMVEHLQQLHMARQKKYSKGEGVWLAWLTTWTCTDILFFVRQKKTAQKCHPYFWTKSFRRCCTRSPVLDQGSWPRIQYSYWALRMRTRKALEPARTFWLTWRRSFKKRQCLSIGKHVVYYPDILWRSPLGLLSAWWLRLLLAMDNRIMKNTLHSCLVTFRTVRVQDNVGVQEVLCR